MGLEMLESEGGEDNCFLRASSRCFGEEVMVVERQRPAPCP